MPDNFANIILITGIPRSGTNLLCSLLNAQRNVVVSAEPSGILMKTDSSMPDQLDWCLGQLKKWRQQVQIEGTVFTRHFGGIIPDNWLSKREDTGSTQNNKSILGNVAINKEIDADFQFIVKSPGAFTALLPILGNAPVHLYTLIRNPLAVLASWNSTSFPVHNGRLPPGEKLDRDLRRELAGNPDRIDRQLLLLSWFFNRYDKYLPKDKIYRYEQLVDSPVEVTQSILGRYPDTRHQTLRARNILTDYSGVDIKKLAERLLESDGAYWKFYSKDDIRELIG